MVETTKADGTICEECEKVFVPGDLMVYTVDPPNTIAMCSNPPVCAECVVHYWETCGQSLESFLAEMFEDGSSISWVLVVP